MLVSCLLLFVLRIVEFIFSECYVHLTAQICTSCTSILVDICPCACTIDIASEYVLALFTINPTPVGAMHAFPRFPTWGMHVNVHAIPTPWESVGKHVFDVGWVPPVRTALGMRDASVHVGNDIRFFPTQRTLCIPLYTAFPRGTACIGVCWRWNVIFSHAAHRLTCGP